MPNITIYSTRTCSFCVMLKSYLQSKSIKYNEKLVDDDPKLAQELMEKSNQLGVPFTVIETDDSDEPQYVLGFDRIRIDQLLKI